jgi:hypothetical protein
MVISNLDKWLHVSHVSFFKGEEGFKLANELIGRALNIPGAAVHWYDKPGQ